MNPSPLQPREFFSGVWRAEGKLIPRFMFRPLFPVETVTMESTPHWLSDTLWVVKESFSFSSGNVIYRTMFCELTTPDRIHVTADDMPGGANILLRENGFFFTPYDVLGYNKGIRWKLRCYDENVLDVNGVIHDTVKMCFLGFPVATMQLTVLRTEK